MVSEYLFEISKKIREKFGANVERIIVFGSYARGEQGVDSDLDLLVVVKDENIEDELRKIVYSFIPTIGRLISVKVVKAEKYAEMKKINLSFIKSVEQEGIVIG